MLFKMLKRLLCGSIVAVCVSGVMYGDELPECQTRQDKIKGCVVIEKNDYEYSTTTTLYKNGKIHGDVVIETDEGYSTIPYKNGKREGIASSSYVEEGVTFVQIHVYYENDKKEGNAKLTEDGEHILTIRFQNDKAIAGKCANGTAIPQSKINEIGTRDITHLNRYELCE